MVALAKGLAWVLLLQEDGGLSHALSSDWVDLESTGPVRVVGSGDVSGEGGDDPLYPSPKVDGREYRVHPSVKDAIVVLKRRAMMNVVDLGTVQRR